MQIDVIIVLGFFFASFCGFLYFCSLLRPKKLDTQVLVTARRCEYLALCNGNVRTAADIRREFGLTVTGTEETAPMAEDA